MSKLTEDKWLSDILAKPAFKLDALDIKVFDPNELARNSFVYVKLSTDKIAEINYLESLGFSVVDTNVVFEKKCFSQNTHCKNDRIRESNAQDKAAVEEIAFSSFSFSRFHLDPLVDNTVASTIKEKWASNYFSGKRGDALLVAEDNGCVVGFNQILLRDNNSAIIDLIAVESNHSKKGLGTELIEAINVFFPKVNKIIVGTQIANISAMRFYENCGFRVASAQYVLHYHGVENENK